MAYKNPFRLTTRRQGEIVGQIYKLIVCYSEFFIPRSRVYLKDVAKQENSIYWLENSKNAEVTAIALVEPKYKLNIDDIELITVGHTLSKVNNQMHNILDHLFSDYKEGNLLILSRELFAQAMQIESKYNFTALDAVQLQDLWPNLANCSTDYFNLSSGENLAQGMSRKGYKLYLRLSNSTSPQIQKKAPDLFEYINSNQGFFDSYESQTS